MPFFFDSHCHYDFKEFDSDRDETWQECLDVGINRMVIPGVATDRWKQSQQISANYKGVYFAVGIHPWWVGGEGDHVIANESQLAEQVEPYLTQPKCVGIGETGLDGIRNENWIRQEHAFKTHLKLAKQLDLPVIIHSVKAHHHILPLLKQFGPGKGVVHGYSGSIDTALNYWKLGYLMGVGGTITYERANKTRDAIRQLPLDAIVLETDAPDMPLFGRQGKRNSPKCIVEIAASLSALRNESLDTIAEVTYANTLSLFGVEI